MAQPMRIAVVAPPFFQVPPVGYGGIEAVLALLVNGLVDRGHDVTLLGAGQQGTRGGFVATYDEPQAERLGSPMPELTHAARVQDILRELRPDVVHDHSAAGPILARSYPAPTVITSHGPATGEWGEYLAAATGSVALVAISRAQTQLAADLPWTGVVHNALDTADIPFRKDKDDYVVWLGRMSPDKAAHLAIDISREAGRRIVLAAKCSEPDEHAYFEEHIQPRLGPDVDYRDEVGGDDKYELLGGAAAFLFPIQWEEPFGMVMLEAMACGTPVVALNRGAVPEIVVDGVNGFVRERTDQLVTALRDVGDLDPAACRARVEDEFSPAKMVAGYEAIYADLVAGART